MDRLMKLLLSFLLPFLCCGMVGHAQWTSLGPTGGNVTAVAERNGIFYAALDPGGVYESTDHMQSWHACSYNLLDRHVKTIEYMPCGDLLVGTERGVYRLTNAQSWEAVDPAVFGGTVIFTLDVMTDRICMAGGRLGAAFRSEDGGRTWTSLATFTRTYAVITDFFAPTTEKWLCAAGDLFASGDSGRTWQRHVQYDSVARAALRIADLDIPEKTTIGVAGAGLAISTNNGISFAKPANGASYTDACRTSNGVYYRSTANDAAVYRPDARQWTLLYVPTNRLFRSSFDSVYALTTTDGIYVFLAPTQWYSNDYGAWSRRSGGLDHSNVSSCWTLLDGTILTMMSNGDVHRFYRTGEVYADTIQRLSRFYIRSLSQSASGKIVANAGFGANEPDPYFSNDNGITFLSSTYFSTYDKRYDKKPAPKDAVCYHPTDDTVIAAVVDHILMDVYIGQYPPRIIEAGKISETFSLIHRGDVVLANTANAIIKHTVGTTTRDTVLRGPLASAPMVCTPQGMIYVVGTKAVYRSNDNGEHWMELPSVGLRHRPTFCVTDAHGIVAVASDSEVVVTLDSGRTWQNYGKDLPVAEIRSITIDSSHRLIVATQGYGLLMHTIDLTTSVSEGLDKEAGNTLDIAIAPNPITEQFTATATCRRSSLLRWQLVSLTGEIIATWSSDHPGETSTMQFVVPSHVVSGMYFLTCTSYDHTRSIQLMYVK